MTQQPRGCCFCPAPAPLPQTSAPPHLHSPHAALWQASHTPAHASHSRLADGCCRHVSQKLCAHAGVGAQCVEAMANTDSSCEITCRSVQTTLIHLQIVSCAQHSPLSWPLSLIEQQLPIAIITSLNYSPARNRLAVVAQAVAVAARGATDAISNTSYDAGRAAVAASTAAAGCSQHCWCCSPC